MENSDSDVQKQEELGKEKDDDESAKEEGSNFGELVLKRMYAVPTIVITMAEDMDEIGSNVPRSRSVVATNTVEASEQHPDARILRQRGGVSWFSRNYCEWFWGLFVVVVVVVLYYIVTK